MLNSPETKEMTIPNSPVGMLYKCMLGHFLPVNYIKPNPEGYLIYLENNDITTGLRVIIEDGNLSVRFF